MTPAPAAAPVPFTAAGHLLRSVRLSGRAGAGAALPTVHLHGLGCHGAWSWADVAARRGRPALIPDLPGHGLSDAPPSDLFGYTLPELADAVAALLRAEAGPGPSPVGPSGAAGPGAPSAPSAPGRGFEIVGHSLGGSIAVHLAARHPHLVARLVLVEPALDLERIAPGGIAAEDEDGLAAGGWERILARESPERRAEVRLTAPHALVRCARALTDEHAARTSALLTGLALPRLLVVGDHRRYADQADYDAAGVRSVRIAGASHFVMRDRPTELLAALDAVAAVSADSAGSAGSAGSADEA
ncbi:alpha/beta fold hydrolase [Brachybacterium sp. DNPG3]